MRSFLWVEQGSYARDDKTQLLKVSRDFVGPLFIRAFPAHGRVIANQICQSLYSGLDL
jgi:hypothetical protein